MSINTARDRQKELIAVWENDGPARAKAMCRNLSEMLSVEEISADYYLGEANALANEMKWNQDMNYMTEKIRHLVEMMAIATKHTPEGEYWERAVKDLRKY